jgi:septal ring factor EnvC (AmiA/AmiB activator)
LPPHLPFAESSASLGTNFSLHSELEEQVADLEFNLQVEHVRTSQLESMLKDKDREIGHLKQQQEALEEKIRTLKSMINSE